MNIGNKIKKLRELRNYTQEEIADKLGVTQSAYSKIELGHVDLPFSKLEEIASILNIPLESIIGFSDSIVFNLKNNKKANGLVINQIAQTERKLYDELIESLKKENSYLKNTIDKLLIGIPKKKQIKK